MSSYFPNRWPLSYLNLTKNMKTYIRRQQHKNFKHQDTKQKEPPQKYRLGTIRNTKLVAGLNRFYMAITSPSARIPTDDLNTLNRFYMTITSPSARIPTDDLKARIPTDDLIPKNMRCRNQHSLAFQIPSAGKEAYKSSFFLQTIRDWNDLPDSLISSAKMSDDCVSRFASLVRARD